MRGLRVLIGGLPPGSALHRAMGQPWSETEHLLASVIDGLQAVTEMVRAANSEDHQFTPPEPFPRPGEEQRAEVERDEKLRRHQRARDRVWVGIGQGGV